MGNVALIRVDSHSHGENGAMLTQPEGESDRQVLRKPIE
jgi:hypothetical protein